MNRFEPIAASSLLALAVSISGCYTKVGVPDPYEQLAETSDYEMGVDSWREYYYVFLPYAPWEAYPGHPWWYDGYHRTWHGHAQVDWDGDEIGRHRNDRGPGAPAGVVGGGSAGTPAPTGSAPAAPPAVDPRSGEQTTNPTRDRAVSDDTGETKEDTSTEPTRAGRRR